MGMGDPYNWSARALHEIRRSWLAYLVGGLVVTFALALWLPYSTFLTAEGKPAVATVVAFAPMFGKGQGGVDVYARSSNGLEGFTRVQLDEISGCRVGDQIAASVIDGRLRLEPAPCTTHGTIGAMTR